MISLKEDVSPYVRIAAHDGDAEIGHAFVYFIKNDLHDAPYALLEDVHVDEGRRRSGVGRSLARAAIDAARARGCYKFIATSRKDGTRPDVHKWYVRLGLRTYGTEFRMDL